MSTPFDDKFHEECAVFGVFGHADAGALTVLHSFTPSTDGWTPYGGLVQASETQNLEKILDAMACGLPVVAPLFGGPTDYCTTDTCFPVEFSLVPMGDCLDSRSLSIANRPLWAEPDIRSLAQQMRKVYDEREAAAALGARARQTVLDRCSWNQAASRLVEIASELQARRPKPSRARVEPAPSSAPQSPYWLGLRVSVIVPTRNRALTKTPWPVVGAP